MLWSFERRFLVHVCTCVQCWQRRLHSACTMYHLTNVTQCTHYMGSKASVKQFALESICKWFLWITANLQSRHYELMCHMWKKHNNAHRYTEWLKCTGSAGNVMAIVGQWFSERMIGVCRPEAKCLVRCSIAHPGCPGQNPSSCKTVVCVTDFKLCICYNTIYELFSATCDL